MSSRIQFTDWWVPAAGISLGLVVLAAAGIALGLVLSEAFGQLWTAVIAGLVILGVATVFLLKWGGYLWAAASSSLPGSPYLSRLFCVSD